MTPASPRRSWILPLGLFATAMLLAVAGPTARAALDYRRDAIADGAWWRLVTAHLVHLGGAHATLDGAALLLVALIFRVELGLGAQALAIAVGVVAIDAGLWFVHPEVVRYAGLSGVLHAWFAAGAAGWLLAGPARGETRDDVVRRRGWGLALTLALVVKLALETRGGSFWLAGFDGPVVTAAHRWGAAGGWLAALVRVAWTRLRQAAGSAARRA